MTELVEAALNGNRRALSRLLTHIENDHETASEAVAALFPYTGRAHRIGITGAPGTGKSTLVAALAGAYRERGDRVAILAVDPTSPFSGGAVLGDRIRMSRLAGDSGVFIRSVAARGHSGGLARTTRHLMHALDAAGYDRVIVETVGAGQSEVAVVRMAETTVVVEAPGLGDGIQAIKAGILEIADVLVINKADLPGARNTRRALKQMLTLGHPTKATYAGHHGALGGVNTEASADDTDVKMWIPPLVDTVATDGQGVAVLVDAIQQHRGYLQSSGQGALNERDAIADEFYTILKETLFMAFLSRLSSDELMSLFAQIQARKQSPKEAVNYVIHEYQTERQHD